VHINSKDKNELVNVYKEIFKNEEREGRDVGIDY
jgi:hypothetical protein